MFAKLYIAIIKVKVKVIGRETIKEHCTSVVYMPNMKFCSSNSFGQVQDDNIQKNGQD